MISLPASDYIKEKFLDFAIFIIDNKEWVIRRMVDWENWRLMNLGSDNYDKLKNSGFGGLQIKKLAGNSIVVSVLESNF